MANSRRILDGALALAFVGVLAAGCGGSKLLDDLNLFVSPATVSFQTLAVNEEDTRTIQLSHIGRSGTIRLNAIEITGAAQGDFTYDPPDKTALAPGEKTTITLHYRPKSETVGTAQLEINHNVPPDRLTIVPIRVLQPVGDLSCDPEPVDFNNVASGAYADKDVLLTNQGSKAITITSIELGAEGSSDFAILGTPTLMEGGELTLPYDLQPKEQIGLVIRYEPKESGCDDSTLLVGTSNPLPYSFVVKGCEEGPRLVVSPGVCDFGARKLNEKSTVDLSLENQGTYLLELKSMVLQPDSDPEIKILNPPPEGTSLNPGDHITVTVEWTAKTPNPTPSFPIGAIRIESTDPKSPTDIPVMGEVSTPVINVFPEQIDFGNVGQLVTSKKQLAIRNDGAGTLTVQSMEVVIDGGSADAGEFQIVEDPAFAPSLKTGAGPGEIKAYESVVLNVWFTNNKAPSGTAQAHIVIKSDTPGKEEISVPMTATRMGKATCNPVLVPPVLNFGMVPIGFSKTLPVTIHNNGSGYCSFAMAAVLDCPCFGGMMCTCPEPFKGQLSQSFSIAAAPPAVQNGIGPGGDAQIKVKFVPPAGVSVFGSDATYQAMLYVKMLDTNVPAGVQPPEINVPSSGKTANITAQSGIAKVAVLPSEVKFGLVTIGCHSKTYKVCVYNTGSAPLTINELKLDGCSPEFEIKGDPGLPKDVNPGVPTCFEVVYVPKDLGEDSCNLAISSTDGSSPTMTVGLSGSGTKDDQQTDEFTQVSGQNVDVLFIIDDSGSMCEEQDMLISNFSQFIQYSKVWNNDYHIGIISLNVVDTKVMGKFNRGDDAKQPRFIRAFDAAGKPNLNAQSDFVKLADLGCDGGSDAQEAALEAAQVALTAPLMTETGVKCSSHTDCQNDKTLCGDPKSCPYYCFEGTCGGYNKGFLREDAQLEIIVLSDEEDQSSAAVSFYVDFLKNIKGFYNTSMMHFNAIVGTDDAACAGSGGSSGAAAEEGKRYLQAAKDTGGQTGSICDSNYATVMNKIGEVAFGLKRQFFLTRLADPPTIKVWVNGNACDHGFKYENQSNSIIFEGTDQNEPDDCKLPKAGQTVKVHYKTLCLKS